MSPASRTAAPWAEVKAQFDALVELPPALRSAALARAAAQAHAPPEVLAEAAALLHQHEAEENDGGHFLATPALLAQAKALAPSASPGLRLGPWQLDAELGRGGMGQVWSAHRADGAYEAQVAVKLLGGGAPAGPGAAAWLAQFLAERRSLARLEHPHIARLLDAGQAEDGRPYLVMEAVHGRPIDQACRGLGLAERLHLFLQLAEAVAHAHRQLLVHRDLKPANVLVTAEGQVKLLDFGIAQPPEPGSPAGGLAGAHPLPLTPLSASPEQLRGEAVGTATDVYSLGVLLHLLLTGTRPYGREATSTAQALHAALHEPALPPSAAPLPADPAMGLPRAWLRGDLDAIVARATAADPAQRYGSVEALAADLRAHLAHEPVAARPAGWRYRAGRFLRRHRASVTVAGFGLAALLALVVGLAWQVHQTEAARGQAEAMAADVRRLANGLVFGHHDRLVGLAGALPAREALLADASRYLDGLAEAAPRDPRLARELMATYQRIATLYGETFSPNLGRLPAAAAAADKALALLPIVVDTPLADTIALNEGADLWQTRAMLHGRAGDLAAQVAALDRAQALVQRALAIAPQEPQVRSRQATLAGRQALVLGGSPAVPNLGRITEAGLRWQQALQVFEGLHREAPDDPEWTHQLAWAVMGRANWALLDGRAAEALALAQRGTALRDAAAAARPDNVHFRYQAAVARLNLATALAAAERPAEALAMQAEGQSRLAAFARADPRNTAAARDLMLAELARARLLVAGGDASQAVPLLRRLLLQLPAAAELEHDFFMRRWRAEAQVWLARALLPGDARGALQQAREAAARMAGPPDRPDDNAARRWMLAQALGEQAQARLRLGEAAAARADAQLALATWGTPVPAALQPRWARDQALAGEPGR